MSQLSYFKDCKSLFAEYKEETEKKLTLESEMGFATYEIFKPSVYIEEIYVRPAFRSLGEARKMIDAIVATAKELGCSKLYGTNCPSRQGSTESMRLALAYGFKLSYIRGDLIWMEKDI